MFGGTLEYLMNSLPYLSFQDDEETKYRLINILEKYTGKSNKKTDLIEMLDFEAQKFLSTSSFAFFKKINFEKIHEKEFQNKGSKVLTAFSTFIFELKKEIRKFRIAQKKGGNKSTKNPIKNIIGEGTPLEKEIRIMKYQWDKLEDLSIGQFTNFEALVVYKIKLLILQRWWSFNKEQGMEHFMRMTINK